MQTRRRFLASGAAVTGAAFLPRTRRGAGAEPRIVVVGAGLAGMTAAYRIYRRTWITPYVYEASDRIGGRTRTIKGLHGEMRADAGGSFISSGDRAILGVMKELGIGLVDLNRYYPTGKRTLFLKNLRRTPASVFRDRAETARNARRQFRDIGWPVTSDAHSAAAEVWDSVTIAEWIEEFTPRGLRSLFGHYLRTYFETEYAGAIEDASSLHLIADFAAPGRNYDERYVVREGSERIVRGIRRLLPVGSVTTGAPLIRLAREGPGCVCTFSNDGTEFDVDADRVVLALPFSALRDVDFSGAGFSEAKDRSIRELGMGANTKVTLQFEKHGWELERSGEAITDLITGWTWPGHYRPRRSEAILVLFNGASFSGAYDGGPAHERASDDMAALHLAAVDEVFPNASSSFIPGEAYIDHWPADPWIKGSYSYYGRGGFTTIAGVEGRRQGPIHFAGEHTASYGNRGTMNGAVRSGELAANQVIDSLSS